MEKLANGLINAVKALRLWQIAALVIVFLGSAGATYGAYYQGANGVQAELTEGQQVLPVRLGNLVNQVSTSGTFTFPQREPLTFETGGTVVEVLAEPNQTVSQGQELAKLDAVTVAALQQGVAQARFDLEVVQELLEDARVGFTGVELAQAAEQVADAEFQLQQANKALDDAREPYTEETVKSQREMAAAARSNLQGAEEALTNLTPDFDLGLAEAVQARYEAEVTLQDTRQALANLELNYSLESAQAVKDLHDVEAALEDARLALTDFEERGGGRLVQTRDDKAVAEADLSESQNALQAYLRAKDEGAYGMDFHISRMQGIVEIKRDFYEALRTEVIEVEQLEAQVELAEEQLAEASERLSELGGGPDPLERQRLEATVQVTQADLTLADQSLADLKLGLDPLEVGLKQAQLELARATLDQAEQDLVEMLEGADSLEVALREAQVVLAQASLEEAQEVLADLLAGPDPLEVALREAQVVSSQLALEEALRLLDKSTLKSPIDGLVTLVNVEEGDAVGAETVIVEVVSPNVMEVEGIVDEIDVLSVQVGVPAQVTLDALPGETFEGRVSEIAASAQNQQGVVSYPIRIEVEMPGGVEPREGLSAVANIILREEQNVLMVPEQALYGSFDQPVVRVMTSLGVEEKPVTLGYSDGFWVSVSQGLSQGDKVVIESGEISTSRFSFRQFRNTTGGGFRSRSSSGRR